MTNKDRRISKTGLEDRGFGAGAVGSGVGVVG